MKHSVLGIFLLLAVSSCTNWVQLTSEGEDVILLPLGQVSSCSRIGSVNATTLNKILFAPRNAEKLEKELILLGRNEAGSMGGNAIVSESRITEGSKRFGVYRC